MKLGYNTWSMPTLPFDQAAPTLARIGYDSVEVTVCEGWATDAMQATDADAVGWRESAADAGLTISSVTANAPLVCDAETWAISRRRLIRSFEVAAVLGGGRQLPVSLGAHKPKAPLLGGDPPPIIAQDSWEHDRQQIIDRFGELADLAVGIGCSVALEPHAGAVVSAPEQAIAVLTEVGSPALGINLDISHFAVRDFDLADVVAKLLPHTVVVEVKDHRRSGDAFDFLIPGEGEFDYPSFFRILDRAGYRGTVSVEISVRRQAQPDFDEVAAAEQSFRTLSAAAVAAGVALGHHGVRS
jgi:sugar phosphate isomerase/epimerase